MLPDSSSPVSRPQTMTDPVFIVAAERSGDDLGAALIRDLRKISPDLPILGIGGARMAAEGVESDYDISPLSVLGFTEGLKAYPIILKRVSQAVDIIMDSGAGTVVLIDSWGFTMRVAQRLRKAGFLGQLIKYVAPQVFAMREGRAKILAESYDHLLTIHSFDAHYFEAHGLQVTYVGNPVYDTDYRVGNGAALRERLKIDPEAPVLAVLFGSRRSEIERLSDPFADCISRLRTLIPDLEIVSPVSESIDREVRVAIESDSRLSQVHLLPETEKLDVFASATASLACSGTATSQLASAGVPTVVAYRLSTLTFMIGKMLFKPDYISLVNIAADTPLMPEFVQKDANGENLADALMPYLTKPDARTLASQKLMSQTDKMKGEGGTASQRAAQTVMNLIGRSA